MEIQDKDIVMRAIAKSNLSYLPIKQQPKVIQDIIKTMHFLGFFEGNALKTNKCSYLEALSDVMASKLALKEDDRDLVVMRHVFKLRDPKSNRKWQHTSTMVASGNSKASGGASIMAQTVGITCGIATRMVLVGKIKHHGVLSPIYEDIYNPILKELESFGIKMIEESENP